MMTMSICHFDPFFPATLFFDPNLGASAQKKSTLQHFSQKRRFHFPTIQQKVKVLINKEVIKKRCWKVCWMVLDGVGKCFRFPTASNKKNPDFGVNVLILRFVGLLESETAISATIFQIASFFFEPVSPGILRTL